MEDVFFSIQVESLKCLNAQLHADNQTKVSLTCRHLHTVSSVQMPYIGSSPLKRSYFRLKVTLPNLQTLDHFLRHRLCPKVCRNLSRILSLIISKRLYIAKKLCKYNLLPFFLNRQSPFLWRGPRKETALAVFPAATKE